jgi:lipid-A-disaccharide synthase-like uncharacterized protein
VRVGWAIVAATSLLVAAAPSWAEQGTSPVEIKLKIPGVQAVELVPVPDAEDGVGFRFRVETEQGVEALSPEQFTRLLYEQHHRRPFWKTFFNITSPVGIAWVTLGLLGQLLFTGRMVVQWLTSERHGRSVVPVAFWWMSLSGASMLLVYFIWRKDVVGILGQSAGWLIYARNLYMIHAKSAVQADRAASGPEKA